MLTITFKSGPDLLLCASLMKFWPVFQALMEIGSLRMFVELQQTSYFGHQHLSDFGRTGKEELLPKIDTD